MMRKERGPKEGYPLSPGARKASQKRDVELAVKEERTLDSWSREGEHCRQRKRGTQKQEVGECVGLGSTESFAVA